MVSGVRKKNLEIDLERLIDLWKYESKKLEVIKEMGTEEMILKQKIEVETILRLVDDIKKQLNE